MPDRAPLTGTVDPTLSATLRDLAPLRYSTETASADDVPPHVRAASAVRRMGARLVVVQDDVNALALHDGTAGIERLLLPAGRDGRRTFGDARGNKHEKMDLEAAATLPDGRLVLFGSGSTPAREQVVVLDPADRVRVVDGAGLYRHLRAIEDFAGSELNVEGALVTGEVLLLLQRGNGAPRGPQQPVNAIGELPLAGFLDWLDRGGEAPVLQRIVRYDLGRVGGTPFTFTDATLGLVDEPADGRPDRVSEHVVFVACAEASPDAVRDGDVLGCRVGVIDARGVRMADVLHPDGSPTLLKVEGIEARAGAAGVFDVVVDVDSEDRPALLGQLDLRAAGRRSPAR